MLFLWNSLLFFILARTFCVLQVSGFQHDYESLNVCVCVLGGLCGCVRTQCCSFSIRQNEYNFFLHLNLYPFPSPFSSLPGVRTLFRPQGALPLRLSLPTPVRQQDLHVLLSPQQHRIQILLQRDWVPGSHAAKPHQHLRWICTQVS